MTTPCWKCGDDHCYCWTCGEREQSCTCAPDDTNLGDCDVCHQAEHDALNKEMEKLRAENAALREQNAKLREADGPADRHVVAVQEPTIPRLVSGRQIAARLRVPLAELLPVLERAGVRVWRIRTGRTAPRIRVSEEDVLRYLRDTARPELPPGETGTP